MAIASEFLPPPLSDEIGRQRLIDRLASRWLVPLVLLEAPGGFGKSVAIAQAFRDNQSDPSGIDLVLTCRSSHRDAAQLAGSVLRLLGAPTPDPHIGLDELAAAIEAALASMAPDQVALILDDVHHLHPDDDATVLLSKLLRSLPTNAHLVLAGRGIPPLRLTRLLAAERVVHITEAELAFTRAEAEALAAVHHREPGSLDLSSGWPALLRLSVTMGHAASLDFLFEEIVDGLDPDVRAALAVAVLARQADDQLLKQLAGPAMTAERLADAVPMATLVSPGTVRAHDLWSEVLHRLVDTDRLTTLAIAVSQWHMEHDRFDEALEISAAQRLWDHARAIIMAALQRGDAELRVARTARWFELFPQDQHDQPELVLLSGITRRMAGDLEPARAEVDRALAGFDARGAIGHRTTAALEAGLMAWLMGDVGRVLQMVGLGEQALEAGIESARWMVELGYAGFDDLQGDASAALARLESIDIDGLAGPAIQLILRWASTLRMLLGDAEGAIAHAERLLARDPSEKVWRHTAIAHWQNSDPTMLLGRGLDELATAFDNARDDFLNGAFGAVIGASIGRSVDVAPLAALATERSRDQTYLAVATAASLVAAGEETAASTVIDGLVDRLGLSDPVCRAELRRFASLCYPLSSRVADALDSESLGPQQVGRRQLARWLVTARSGRSLEWAALPETTELLTGLPLRWSLELAARGAEAGSVRAIDLADYLIGTVGPPARALLETERGRPGFPEAGVDAIFAAIPAQPAHRLHITTCGRLQIAGDPDPPTGLLRRSRVRELLSLLLLRQRVTSAQAITVLWPGLDVGKARANLRTTLNYLRQLLEPDRPRGQPSFHVRRRGETLWIERSDLLVVDLWEIREALAQGRDLERHGRTAEAVAARRRAVDRWSGELLPDLRGHPDLAAELTYLDLELEAACASVAEWALARGDEEGAEELGQRLLAHDPFSERAYGVVIGARLARGELGQAWEAMGQCRAALEELGAEPSASTAMLHRRLQRLARTFDGPPMGRLGTTPEGPAASR